MFPDHKAEALARLENAHREIRKAIGVGDWPLVTAEQIHGNKIAIVDKPVGSDKEFAGCDGLITNQRRIALGVYVADCCAVYIVDPKTPAIGLVHSGRKGTELGVVTNAIRQMIDRFGSDPAKMIVQLSPCVRPPHYESISRRRLSSNVTRKACSKSTTVASAPLAISTFTIPTGRRKVAPAACWG